jgi:hypothetical protein
MPGGWRSPEEGVDINYRLKTPRFCNAERFAKGRGFVARSGKMASPEWHVVKRHLVDLFRPARDPDMLYLDVQR